MDRIVVTGIGVISAIGNTVAENRVSLIEGKCGMGQLKMFPSKFAESLPVGEIRISTEALKEKLDAYEPGVTRTTLLALHAMQEALADSNFTSSQISAVGLNLVNANAAKVPRTTDEHAVKKAIFSDNLKPEMISTS